ncbi:hypothetical protein DF3PA_10087 [Candidatus Defluviicoccus seviourii]|uniref:Uncharacterized protein n=1 Tax=Candidatus Defluviicoccus seviourii TaxID=2565273 RepID=A0A564WAJ0_9PROT|nr:hypothetical protein DF3PA_10087 [Candidatus Defluviicoccus seviourii]
MVAGTRPRLGIRPALLRFRCLLCSLCRFVGVRGWNPAARKGVGEKRRKLAPARIIHGAAGDGRPALRGGFAEGGCREWLKEHGQGSKGFAAASQESNSGANRVRAITY